MKKIGIFVIFLLIIPIAVADISIKLPEKDVYNLGDSILPSISIKEDQDYDGFFNLRMICDDADLRYYATPLKLESGLRTQINVPELSLFESMKGTCRIKAEFEDSDGKSVESSASGPFTVSDKLEIVVEENLQAKPGERVVISANVERADGELLGRGSAKITFLNKTKELSVVAGVLVHPIEINYNSPAGTFPLEISVRDDDGNSGKKSLNVQVMAIPTKIENKIQKNPLEPGETFNVIVNLYDHNANIIEGNKVNVKVLDQSGKILQKGTVPSSERFSFRTGSSQPAGDYYFVSSFEGIQEQSTFSVIGVKRIRMRQDGSLIHIENTGNVAYNDEATIIAEDENNKYFVNKLIELEPQETTTIDLSKELPEGIYDLTLPDNAVSENAEGSANLVADVYVEDNGNVLSEITGTVVSVAKIIGSKPTIASIILITMILGVLAFYGRGFIMGKIKRKKEDSDIFSDFKFEKKG